MLNNLNNYIKNGLVFSGPIFAFMFGLSTLFFVLSAGDGTWFLYSKEVLNHKQIYSDLKLTAQPIFPLINIAGLYLFGSSYFSQKLLFIIILSFYVHSLYLLLQLIDINVLFRSVIYVALFFMGIHFEAFRFDDYHALANALFLYSIYYGYKFINHQDLKCYFIFSVLSSITFLTRINQGLAVIFSFGLLMLFTQQKISTKVKFIFINIILTVILTFILISLTSETPLAWFYSTIYNASSAKGGDSIFFYPLKLISNSFTYIYSEISKNFYWNLTLFFCLFVSIFFFTKNKIISSSLFIVFIISLYKLITNGDIIIESTAFIVLFLFIMSSILLLYNFLPARYQSESKYLKLLFFPIFLFIFSSLSSGGYFYGLYFESSVTFLVLLIIYQKYIKNNYFILFYFLFVALSGCLFRFNNPYSWHSYHVSPLFSSNYKYENFNFLGPHFIAKDLANHINPVCKIVSSSDGTLLSLPFSFANYYCGIPIWNGYVQTFFDTSTPLVINNLINDLKDSPPDFIFYQRQIDNMRGHEIVFNKGNPLPHRALDAFIMDKINAGTWMVVYKSDYAPPSNWFLISTKLQK